MDAYCPVLKRISIRRIEELRNHDESLIGLSFEFTYSCKLTWDNISFDNQLYFIIIAATIEDEGITIFVVQFTTFEIILHSGLIL